MKLATWNVNSLTVRLPQVLDWLEAQKSESGIDVLNQPVTRSLFLDKKLITAWH